MQVVSSKIRGKICSGSGRGQKMSAYDDLYSEYKKLAKRADERLRSLERASKKEGYRDVLRYSYSRAQYDIAAFTGKEKAFGRFDVRPVGETAGERYNMLQKMMASVKAFLNSETSTIGPAKGSEGQRVEGVRGIYEKRAQTTNEAYGTSFTWQQMATYWLSGLGEKLNAMYGSKTALAMVAKNPKKTAAILRSIEKANKRGQMVSDAQLDVMIEAALGSGPTIDEL